MNDIDFIREERIICLKRFCLHYNNFYGLQLSLYKPIIQYKFEVRHIYAMLL